MAFHRFSSFCLLASALTTLGCHAQEPIPAGTISVADATPVGVPLSPDLARRVEVILREKAELPPETTVNVLGRTPSEFAGYDTVTVTVSNEGRVSKPILFVLSKDGKTLAQITKFDISADPKTLVSGEGRPARGGPVTAPVLIVGFDDLECPYCARLHGEIFPALTQRYGEQVRIVYKDFPLPADQHPWATRAAIDTNCLAAQSNDGYWSEVDYIHAHAGEFGADPKDPKEPKTEKTLQRATEQLDALTREQGKFRKVDAAKLDACLTRQDATAVNASRDLGTSLGLQATPTLFINGDKIDGAVSLQFLYGIIDQALRVAGVQPPPTYVAPKSAVTAPSAAPSGTAPTGR